MPLKINELVIQARFEEEEAASEVPNVAASIDMEVYREEILRECMEKVEEYLNKRKTR